MREVQKEDESSRTPVDIFVCYAQKDEEYRQRLEKHLSLFQREGLIQIWHNGNIRAGEEWEQIIHMRLDTARIVLLLVSSDFLASDYYSSAEMQKALERHARRETHVIPILVRPVRWQEGPLGKLQALPTKNAKPVPIALWKNRDEAFLHVAEGIRQVLQEREIQPFIFSLLHQQSENSEESLQNISALGQKPPPETPLAQHEVPQELTGLTSSEGLSQTLIHSSFTSVENEIPDFDQPLHPSQSKNVPKKRLLISTAILLVLAISLIPFLPLPTCSLIFCHSLPQSTKQPSPQNGGEVQDQNLSIELIDVVSPSFVFLDNPNHYSGSNTPPTNMSAVLLPTNTVSYCHIIVAVQNVRLGGVDILIDDAALKLLSIPETPRPLRVWTSGVSTTYNTYPYPVTYQGQSLDQLPNQLLYAVPPQNVILGPARNSHSGESNQLSIQVMPTVTAYLWFQIQVSYQIGDAAKVYILTLPQIFQVVFSDASNWQEYILQNGSFVKKS